MAIKCALEAERAPGADCVTLPARLVTAGAQASHSVFPRQEIPGDVLWVVIHKGQTAGRLSFYFALFPLMGASLHPSSFGVKTRLTFQVETEPDHLVSFGSLGTLGEQ